jgi:hypothetical protein
MLAIVAALAAAGFELWNGHLHLAGALGLASGAIASVGTEGYAHSRARVKSALISGT